MTRQLNIVAFLFIYIYILKKIQKDLGCMKKKKKMIPCKSTIITRDIDNRYSFESEEVFVFTL